MHVYVLGMPRINRGCMLPGLLGTHGGEEAIDHRRDTSGQDNQSHDQSVFRRRRFRYTANGECQHDPRPTGKDQINPQE